MPRLHVINAYAPQAGRPTAEKEDFYEKLQKVIDGIPEKDQYIVIGDFNAKLDGRLEEEKQHIGPHVFNPDEGKRERAKAEVQENRELFMLAVIQNDWVVKNTWFEKTDRSKVTFRTKGAIGWDMQPGNFEQIDHVLVPRKWANSIKNVETDTTTGLYSDHFPTIVEIRTKLKKQDKGKNNRRGLIGRKQRKKQPNSTAFSKQQCRNEKERTVQNPWSGTTSRRQHKQ